MHQVQVPNKAPSQSHRMGAAPDARTKCQTSLRPNPTCCSCLMSDSTRVSMLVRAPVTPAQHGQTARRLQHASAAPRLKVERRLSQGPTSHACILLQPMPHSMPQQCSGTAAAPAAPLTGDGHQVHKALAALCDAAHAILLVGGEGRVGRAIVVPLLLTLQSGQHAGRSTCPSAALLIATASRPAMATHLRRGGGGQQHQLQAVRLSHLADLGGLLQGNVGHQQACKARHRVGPCKCSTAGHRI